MINYSVAMRNSLLLRGVGASPGVARGKVSLLKGGAEAIPDAEDCIVVARMPHFCALPLLLGARAVVTEYGGLTCHAAILARELGIPCVVAANGATRVLFEGQEDVVDGVTGEIWTGDD